MTNYDKIQLKLKRKSNLCDDCLSIMADVKPRQTVYQICTKKSSEGLIIRKKGKCAKCKKIKIINKLGKGKMAAKATIVRSYPKKDILPNFGKDSASVDQIRKILGDFSSQIKTSEIEIYNEFSLQHELGIFLRQRLPNNKVQFERNVSYFGFDKTNFIKKEIDISIFRKDQKLLTFAIELKFPTNGQHPEQMYSFCKDIKFTEELKSAGFERTYVVIFANDHLFYSGNQEGIYGFFRGGKTLQGKIEKPTGKVKTEIILKGKYDIKWFDVFGKLKYSVIEAQ